MSDYEERLRLERLPDSRVREALRDAVRERDEARVDSDFWSKQARKYAAERDRLRKDLQDIQNMSHYKTAQFYPSAVEQVLALHRIAREALAGTEDET